MLKSYVLLALRNLWKHRGYALINIFGLAIGLASSILISLYVINELSYDRFHADSERIYRVWIEGSMPATEMRHAVSSPPMAEALLKDYPEVEQACRLKTSGDRLVRRGDRVFQETEREFIFADSTFFDLFSFRLIRGNPATCLRDPRSIVLTEEYARKFFGDEDPMGQTLKMEQDTNVSVITGVMQDIPQNSHIHFKMIGSLSTLSESESDQWVNHNFYTYIKLLEGTDPLVFEERMREMVIKYMGPMLAQITGVDFEAFEEAGNSYGYMLQNLTDIHLRSNLQYELESPGNPLYVYVFLVAAILILVIAGINFMNLATARSTIRAKEVGLRKVAGSKRSQLIAQFLTESVLLSLFSLLLAVVIVSSILPAYNNLIQLQLAFNILSKTWIIPLLLGFAVLVGILAGSYPAFVLASFRPTAIFSSEKRNGAGKSFLRSMMIILQFTVTIVILIGTFVVNRQLHFMQDKDPGFQKENVLLIKRSDVLGNRVDAFKEDVMTHSNVLEAANATHIPSYGYWENGHLLEGWDRSAIFTLATCYVSYDYDKVLDLELVSGRFFDRNMPTDSVGVVVNEATVEALGLEDPLNARFVNPGRRADGEEFFLPIIGVVKDFHYASMHHEIKPMAIHFMPRNYGGLILFRLGNGNVAETIDFIQEKWGTLTSEYPFEYLWMDDEFNRLFDTERRTGHILAIFSILSIFITCLGLLGLISYTANQRTREIGIRKIMGASVQVVMRLLSREMIYLLGISALISIPAYFGTKAWLQRFAFHIHFEAGVYFLMLALVSLVVLGVSLLTVSYHSYRASIANPAESLRME